MSTELKPGVYRHYKPGANGKPQYYLLEFVADFWGLEAVEQDQRLAVVIDFESCVTSDDGEEDPEEPELHIENATDDPTVCTVPLFYARAHGRIEPRTDCVVYVPLYADKPGLRRSVRPVSEWTELLCIRCGHAVERHYDAEGTSAWACQDCATGSSFGKKCGGERHRTSQRFTYVGETIPQEGA